MTIAEALHWGSGELKESVERPRLEAELLLSHCLKKKRIYLHIHEQDEIEDTDSFQMLIQRRATQYPLEYLINRASFCSLGFYVDERVLIPRPETEILVEKCVRLIKDHDLKYVAEIGTGSGVISIMLALWSEVRILATDISEKALEVARQNARIHGVEDRIDFRHTSLLEGVEGEFGLIVSNPPYLAHDFPIEENLKSEPQNALFGGVRGHELLYQIVDEVKVRKVCFLACEMGWDQRAAIQEKANEVGVKQIEFYQDLAGLDRGFLIEY